jgi:phage-related minor tail protein
VGTVGVVIVCDGIGGGEEQPSTCGICHFLVNTEARLLARVALCMFYLVSVAAAIEPIVAGRNAMVTVLFVKTWPAGATWLQALWQALAAVGLRWVTWRLQQKAQQ